MSDWQKDLSDFNKGLLDMPESRLSYNRLNSNMQRGRRLGGHDKPKAVAPPPDEAVADNGTAWIMDDKGNFTLRMNAGGTLSVGYEPDEKGKMRQMISVQGKSDKPIEQAANVMLVHKSLGRESIKIEHGSKKSKRIMWAAAKFADIEVDEYQPDRAALELLQEVRR